MFLWTGSGSTQVQAGIQNWLNPLSAMFWENIHLGRSSAILFCLELNIPVGCQKGKNEKVNHQRLQQFGFSLSGVVYIHILASEENIYFRNFHYISPDHGEAKGNTHTSTQMYLGMSNWMILRRFHFSYLWEGWRIPHSWMGLPRCCIDCWGTPLDFGDKRYAYNSISLHSKPLV